jgi:cytochrome c peroxidase
VRLRALVAVALITATASAADLPPNASTGGTADPAHGAATVGAATVGATDAPTAAPNVLAPGYFDLEYPAPTPGTYALPPLRVAADGLLLDEHGTLHHLYDYLGDRVVLLSFIYTTCNDVNGCPLASFVLKRVQDRALAQPDLHDRLRIVSVSFDPAHDTPAAMSAYAARVRAPGFDWVFLTPRSEAALQPLLDRYDQAVFRDDAGAISHILRVMLIDRQRRVRNIYSVSFLHADTVLSDVESLLMESAKTASTTRLEGQLALFDFFTVAPPAPWRASEFLTGSP